MWLPSPSILVAFTLLLVLFAQDVDGRSLREPRTGRDRLRKHGGREQMMRALKRQAGSAPRADASQAACGASSPANITAPKRNLWNQLSSEEVDSVVEWLFERQDLNLTSFEDAGEWDNTILLVETMRPNKTDALEYIHDGGKEPLKYARVTLDKRATMNPVYADILVGPLPIDRSTASWQPLGYPFNKGANGQVRNLNADADEALWKFLYRQAATIRDITMDLFNGTIMGRRNDTLEVWGIDPLWQEDDGRILRWDTFWNLARDYSDAQTIMPTGLFVLSDVTGRDPKKWKVEGWLYNGVFYPTAEEFRAAYWSAGFEKLGVNVEGDWARTDQQGPPLPQDSRHPPVMVAPGGSRFSLDRGQRYVEWMDWTFYMGFTRDAGVALYDVRFKGQRVLYELGMQEALSHYAGNDPVQSGTAYLDTFYGFGPYTFELVKGYDCPSYATYLDTTYYVADADATHPRSICLFESAVNHPIQRHSTDTYVSVTRNTQFVVRQVSTIANYDYIFSYVFALDGSLSIDVRASGFIQAAHYKGNEDYGFHIHDFLSGSMHDHVLNFKIDFDVLGTANTAQLVRPVPATRSYPWMRHGGGKRMQQPRNTMALERRTIRDETESRLDWDAEGATHFLVVNTDERTAQGEPRGYRILRSSPTARLTVRDSTVLGRAARWAEHDVQVTRAKDTEPWSSHPYQNQDVRDPPVDFDRFFDDAEPLGQEDLVVWLNLGMHHVPHSGDLPNTVFTAAHTGVRLVPHNFLPQDASRSTVNMVRLSYEEGVTTEVLLFGQSQEVCELAFEPVEAGLWAYQGAGNGGVVAARKYGYNPNNPFHVGDGPLEAQGE